MWVDLTSSTVGESLCVENTQKLVYKKFTKFLKTRVWFMSTKTSGRYQEDKCYWLIFKHIGTALGVCCSSTQYSTCLSSAHSDLHKSMKIFHQLGLCSELHEKTPSYTRNMNEGMLYFSFVRWLCLFMYLTLKNTHWNVIHTSRINVTLLLSGKRKQCCLFLTWHLFVPASVSLVHSMSCDSLPP